LSPGYGVGEMTWAIGRMILFCTDNIKVFCLKHEGQLYICTGQRAHGKFWVVNDRIEEYV
jgi:hypothetical protein